MEQAMDSCLGELAERVSAFCDIKDNKALGYKNGYQLHKYSYNQLSQMGHNVIDPN